MVPAIWTERVQDMTSPTFSLCVGGRRKGWVFRSYSTPSPTPSLGTPPFPHLPAITHINHQTRSSTLSPLHRASHSKWLIPQNAPKCSCALCLWGVVGITRLPSNTDQTSLEKLCLFSQIIAVFRPQRPFSANRLSEMPVSRDLKQGLEQKCSVKFLGNVCSLLRHTLDWRILLPKPFAVD